MNTVETRIRTTSTHPAVDARLAAAARLAREATLRHSAAEACRAVVDALSAPSLEFEGIAISLDEPSGVAAGYQVVAGTWPPSPAVEAAAIFTVPLLLDDARIGELTVYRTAPDSFLEGDAALITAAASHASLGVARARLLEELERRREKGGRARSAAERRSSATRARARPPRPRRAPRPAQAKRGKAKRKKAAPSRRRGK